MGWTTLGSPAKGDSIASAWGDAAAANFAAIAAGAVPLAQAWTNVSSFSNGWVAGTEAPRCCVDIAGNIHFEGGANPGTLTDGTVICTLPSSVFYPGAAASGIAYPITSNAVSTTQSPRVTITTAGQVAVKGLTSGATFINFWIIYRAD